MQWVRWRTDRASIAAQTPRTGQQRWSKQMNKIIAGGFGEQARADQAKTALEATGFPRDQIATFFVNPPGQHDLSGTPRDPEASAGAHHAGTGAALGAASGTGVGIAVGLVTLPVLGPGAAVAGAAIGAYVGSLAGALEQMHPAERPVGESAYSARSRDEAAPRHSGMLVAVSAPSSAEEASAITVLRAQGATYIEHAQGSITQGEWGDFDPLSTPALVSVAA
jgi:hypothetical protein